MSLKKWFSARKKWVKWGRRKPLVYLVNDTSGYHSGCESVMRSLYSELSHCKVIAVSMVHELTYDREALKAADWLVVNGEGTIHSNATKAKFLLQLLAHAQGMGKKTALINTIFQKMDCHLPAVLSNLDIFTVRESLSYEEVKKYCHVAQPRICLDSAADRSVMQPGTPEPGISGVVYGSTHEHAKTHGVISERKPCFDLWSGSWDDIVATLRNVEVYVTGRHHGLYAAALARCTFVPIESNSHKISALIKWSGCQIPVIQLQDDDIDSAIQWAINNRPIYDRFFNWFELQDVTRLGTKLF